MINLLVGTAALPEGPVRWELEIDGPEMRAKYKRNRAVVEVGRMLRNNEEYVYDSEMGDLEFTGMTLTITGPGKCQFGLGFTHDREFIDCTLQNNLRFYRKPKPKELTNGEAARSD
jgi:hypothetical protein